MAAALEGRIMVMCRMDRHIASSTGLAENGFIRFISTYREFLRLQCKIVIALFNLRIYDEMKEQLTNQHSESLISQRIK